MRRLIPLLALAAALAACGGDKAARPLLNSTSTPVSTAAPVSAPTEAAATRAANSGSELVSAHGALSDAAAHIDSIDTMRAEFTMEMAFGRQTMSFGGDMLYRNSDQSFYMTMELLDQHFEVLAYLPDMYIRVPDHGWQKVDLSAAGINLDQFKELADNKGFFDLDQLSDSLGDITDLGDETIDGKTYRHYHADTDFAHLAGELPDGIIDPSLLDKVQDAIHGVSFDFFIEPGTDLMRRVAFKMDMDVPGAGNGGMTMTFDVLEYNGPVDIPTAPTNTEPFDPSSFGG